ncbi:MAG: DUF3703 domain-containing protein [Polyangia bacterium]
MWSYIRTELDGAAAAEAQGDLARAWRALERAHVLSQPFAWPHVRVHAAMLRLGWKRRDSREVVGQLVRLLVAAPGTWLGRAPRGNTGGADVGILQTLPIPADLQALLDEVKAAAPRRRPR